MIAEWIIVSLLLAGVWMALGRWFRSTKVWFVLTLAYAGALGSVGWWQRELDTQNKARAALALKTPATQRPGGYISSDTCRACHPEQYRSWHDSFHRTMTQLPSRQTVRGDFENVTLELAGEKYHLERRGDEYYVDMVDPDWNYVQVLRRNDRTGQSPPPDPGTPPRKLKRITMLTGSHHMQAYWTASDYGNMQYSFPFTYVFESRRWLPRNDVFLMDPAIKFNPQVWNMNCLNCHATAGQPRQDPRTKVIDSRIAEYGIACEACHGPAETHVNLNRDPTRRYALHQRQQGDSSIFNPARAAHIKASETCGQCHAIRRNVRKAEWNRDGLGFVPGGDLEAKAPLIHYDGADLYKPGNEQKRALMEGSFWNDGQVRISGRDFTGMAGSACYQRGQLSCLSCHSLHHYESTAHQLSPQMDGNQACLQCHQAIGSKLEAHTHHTSNSSGSLCYNCHMPHTVYGLMKGIRSHHIDSPKASVSVDTGRPNACNLCHLDRTLDWTARQLNTWYSQPIPNMPAEHTNIAASLVWLLKGDAGQRALMAWHMGWEPARQASGESWMAPALAETLLDPYSTVRYIAARSVKRLAGFAALDYDYIAPAEARARGRQRVLELWNRPRQPAPGREHLLLGPDGSPQDDKIAALLKQRNNRRMELLE
jgi:hypothetical protein